VNIRRPAEPPGAAPLPEERTPVPSPCIGICRMVPAPGWPDPGLCEGCLRTIDEIALWRDADDDARRAMWRAIRQRQRQD
jgi:predicted Fe-S protein YdhL (DUF1289 family)